MPVEIVQMGTNSADATTSVSVTLGAAPAEGNYLVAVGSSPTLGSIGINNGNGWVTSQSGGTGPTVLFTEKWAGASESATQTLGEPSSTGNRRMTLFELSGADGGDPINDFGTTSGTGVTSLLSDELFTIYNDSPVFVCMQTATATPSFANTWTNGFTQQSVVGSNHTVATRFDTTISSYTTTETWSTSSNVRSYGLTLNPANPLRVDITAGYVAESASATSLALDGGAGAGTAVPAGDLRVAFFAARNGSYAELNTPSGWTGIASLGSSPGMRAMYRVSVGGGEKSGETFTSTVARHLLVREYTLTKVNQESPIGNVQETSATSTTSLPIPSFVLDEAGAVVFIAAAGSNNAGNFDVSWTNSFPSVFDGRKLTATDKKVVSPGSYSTTASWPTAMDAAAIAVVVKQEPTPLVAGDGWGISG